MSKKKILFLSDHPLSTSGVGVQSRYLIQGLINTGRYTFRCFGGAMKHQDYNTMKVNDDFIIKPTNGFGDKNLLRQTLAVERPDAVFLFTDPRFFLWVWEMEDEIHQVCPIVYNHLWDNDPAPEFNKILYESTDLINCINHPTYEMVKTWLPERTNYIPHAVPTEIFFPLSDADASTAKAAILGKDRADHFIVLFVSRNARRKAPSDVMMAFKTFLDQLEVHHSHRKATLVMHTEPLDPEGPNLHHVIEMLDLKKNVVFSKDRVGFPEMNSLYNLSDCVVNISLNEGFGLSVLEAKMCGKPVIANTTGGLTRQVLDHETGEEYGVAIRPAARCMVGNQMVPFIFEDITNHNDVSNAYMKMYELGVEGRKALGERSRAHALKNYRMESLIGDWDRTLTETTEAWKKGTLPNNKRWATVKL